LTEPLLEVMFRSLRASARLIGKGAEGNRVLELEGVTAAIVPAAPDRSVVNSVVYDSADVLANALGTLADTYEEAGVRAWTVWTRDGDERAVRTLESAGHRLDASPQAMGMALSELRDPPGAEPEWSSDWDLDAAGLINDRAYGDPEGLWSSALGELPKGIAHLYLVRLDGKPASMVMVHDHGGDCAFWFAATVPEARGRGLVSSTLHRALVDARERGCETTTTQATAMGRPIYARLGYRDLGPIPMYERRKS
jgi:ribosomal protein S18 acetylase RimI-like enzyme